MTALIGHNGPLTPFKTLVDVEDETRYTYLPAAVPQAAYPHGVGSEPEWDYHYL